MTEDKQRAARGRLICRMAGNIAAGMTTSYYSHVRHKDMIADHATELAFMIMDKVFKRLERKDNESENSAAATPSSK